MIDCARQTLSIRKLTIACYYHNHFNVFDLSGSYREKSKISSFTFRMGTLNGNVCFRKLYLSSAWIWFHHLFFRTQCKNFAYISYMAIKHDLTLWFRFDCGFNPWESYANLIWIEWEKKKNKMFALELKQRWLGTLILWFGRHEFDIRFTAPFFFFFLSNNLRRSTKFYC